MGKFLSLLLSIFFLLFLLSLKKPELRRLANDNTSLNTFCDCQTIGTLNRINYSSTEWKFEWSAPSGGWSVDHYIYGGYIHGYGSLSGTTTETYVIVPKGSGTGTFRVRVNCGGYPVCTSDLVESYW